ncbi:MAG: amino acid ABC transporter substrate-binding protein [Chloroflexi bacterium]|nr:amino acid ABC transporter substrate-binding protein [Chloroflexota bacterium]MDA1270754.1 amino acid ABC transporter substrate-binding protein [Chloroflexota bacterium]
MKRKYWILFAGLFGLLALAAVACGDSATATPGPDSVTPEPEAKSSRLDLVESRGKLLCAGRTDLAGFGYLTSGGANAGFDVDLCRAVAAAVFGDGDAMELIPITASERGPTIQAGEVDLLSRNVTWTSTRDAQWGNFTTTMFYDGQGFMVPKSTGFTSALDLDGATVCVTSGTTTELNLADYFRQNGLALDTVVFEDTASVYGAYENGRCDATTSDRSQLAAVRSGFADPDAHVILPETISKEPLTPLVSHGDDQWFDVVKTVMSVLINAEELGVTSANVDAMQTSDNIVIRRMLGAEGEFGQSDLGLRPTFAVDVIKAVGNYGEIYDRYMGPNGDSFTLPRGLNELWNNGGLIYSPPLR